MQTPDPTPAPTQSSPPMPTNQPVQSSVDYPQPPKNRSTPPFNVLVKLFERLADEKSHDKRRKFIRVWFSHWREEVGHDLYPVLRLLLPHKDRERTMYQLKETNLAKVYIKLLALDKSDPDANRLLNWRKPTAQHESSGDFPNVFLDVVSKRSSLEEGSLTIDQINHILDDLSRNSGKSKAQAEILQKVYNESTALEQSWLIRIVLRDMNISVKETTVFDVFHPDAHDLFNTCSDLKKVAWELWDPAHRLGADEKTVQLFRAFAPMLCKRPAPRIEESIKDMQGSTFFIEEKLDGERIQLHKRGNEYFYCSRKGKDYTYLYGKHVGEGSLTPFIADCFDERVEEIILDGELLVWDPVSERVMPFGTLKTAAAEKSKDNDSRHPCFKIFDILYLNGMALLHKPVKFRKRNLKACVSELKGRLEFVEEFEGKTAKDVRRAMAEVMDKRGEGLVLKHPQSIYILNGRNKDWIKVKPEYMDNLGETFDLLVVAGAYGSGRRGGGVSILICAVLDDRPESGHNEDDGPRYSTICRVGSGLKFSDYAEIRRLPWKQRNKNDPPHFIQTVSNRQGVEDKGDMYLEPEDSFIVQIKAAEIIPTDAWHTGYTFRFPRVQMIRRDLTADDCMTIQGILQHIRTNKKRKSGNGKGSAIKKRKITKKQPALLSEFKAVDLEDVKVTGNIFEGLTFTVSSDPKSATRDVDRLNLLKLIKANSGKYMQVAKGREDLLVVYGGATAPYDIKMIMNNDKFDIIRPEWLTDSVEAGRRLPLMKKYFFHATLRRQAAAEYNQLGPGDGGEEEDSETEPDDDEDNDDLATSLSPPKASTKYTSREPVAVEVDPAFDEWFGAPRDTALANSDKDDESAADPDSDHEDFDDDGADEWFSTGRSQTLDTTDEQVANFDISLEQQDGKDNDAKMGENDVAMSYDEEHIFKHLCFYLDSPSNARKNDLPVTSKHEDAMEQRLSEIEKLITDNGGRISTLEDPKLTHIVLDKRDHSRRRELMRRTSMPKHRYLVESEFIEGCLEEGTLLDEADYAA